MKDLIITAIPHLTVTEMPIPDTVTDAKSAAQVSDGIEFCIVGERKDGTFLIMTWTGAEYEFPDAAAMLDGLRAGFTPSKTERRN